MKFRYLIYLWGLYWTYINIELVFEHALSLSPFWDYIAWTAFAIAFGFPFIEIIGEIFCTRQGGEK